MSDAQTNILAVPAVAYSVVPSDPDQLICLKAGERGYNVVNPHWTRQQCQAANMTPAMLAAKINESQGVTPADLLAMLAGTRFGWDNGGASPSMYPGAIWSDALDVAPPEPPLVEPGRLDPKHLSDDHPDKRRGPFVVTGPAPQTTNCR